MFFVNTFNKIVTVYGIGYRLIRIEYFWPQLNNVNLEDIWYQQNMTRHYFANETAQVL